MHAKNHSKSTNLVMYGFATTCLAFIIYMVMSNPNGVLKGFLKTLGVD